MSITFFIPDSPTREVVYGEGAVDEFRTTEDIWPSVNFANSNAFVLINQLAAITGLKQLENFDYCGRWSANEACEIAGAIIATMEDHNFPESLVARLLRLFTVVDFAQHNNMQVCWS